MSVRKSSVSTADTDHGPAPALPLVVVLVVLTSTRAKQEKSLFLLWTRLHFSLRGGGGRLCVSRKHCLRSLSSLLPSAHYATAPEKTGKKREGSSLLPFSLCNSLGKVARILLSFPPFLCAFQKRRKGRKTHFSQINYKLPQPQNARRRSLPKQPRKQQDLSIPRPLSLSPPP